MECEKSYMEIKEKGEKTSFIDQLFHKTELRAFFQLQFLPLMELWKNHGILNTQIWVHLWLFPRPNN